ncbi:hypothetical protein [Microbacterium sp.]|uniref:hypothetical protein n=1 Tax=Microbacterium sp. TaxID=51671 RepID=UPI0037C6525B
MPSTPSRASIVVVTIAIVLVYLSALSSVALGILIMLSRYRVPDDLVLVVTLVGAATILLGLLMIAVASGLSRGSRFARVLITVYFGLLVVLNVITIVSSDDWDAFSVVQTIVQALVVAALWVRPGSLRFPPRSASAEPAGPGSEAVAA